MVAGLWVLLLQAKGYLAYAGPLFLVTSAVFLIWPSPITGLLALLPLILMACVPARMRGLDGQWELASRNGSLRNWFLPNDPREDIGAITGDASIHLIVIGMVVIFFGCLSAGAF